MICTVQVDVEGAVVVVVDSDEALDEDAQRLQGLELDAMLDRASKTAIETWFSIHSERGGHDADNAE